MSQLILFDLPSKGRRSAWSLNPWKTRLALNYKNIDYKTEWIEYPDVKKTLSPHVPPNEGKDATPYTIPAVKFPDGTYIMDSKPISVRLEKDYPSPSLHLDSPLLAEVEKLLPKVAGPLRGVWMPLVPGALLTEVSSDYFHRTRSFNYGRPLEVYAKEHGGEEAWMAALPGIQDLGKLIQCNGGPFVMGKTPSYADFYIVGFLHFMKLIDVGFYSRIVMLQPAFGVLYDASTPWLERDDH